MNTLTLTEDRGESSMQGFKEQKRIASVTYLGVEIGHMRSVVLGIILFRGRLVVLLFRWFCLSPGNSKVKGGSGTKEAICKHCLASKCTHPCTVERENCVLRQAPHAPGVVEDALLSR